MYIYGGRDLNKGTLGNLWAADLQPLNRINDGELNGESGGIAW